MNRGAKEIELLKELIDKVSYNTNLSTTELLDALKPSKDLVDITIFSSELSPLESLVKYLRETKYSKLADIARLLQRNQNTIQTTYKNANKKHPGKINIYSSVKVPLYIFSNSKNTIFESLIKYLKEEENMTNRDIAKTLNKSSKTIWTVYDRVSRK